MTRIPATIAWAGGLAAMCLLLAVAWTWHRPESAREVALAAIGPGSGAEGDWPKGLADRAAVADIGDRSRATRLPASGRESPEADPGDALPLEPIPQPDVAWEPPLGALRDRDDGRLEVDAECRPIEATQTSRPNERGNAAGDGEGPAPEKASGGEPTLAPPLPPESAAGRRVIRVMVEAEQTARKQDAQQP